MSEFPPARLRFGKHGYALDPDERQAWRGIEVVSAEDRLAAVEALRYLVDRCEREFGDQGKPPELDFVMLAVNEVREKLPVLGGTTQ